MNVVWFCFSSLFCFLSFFVIYTTNGDSEQWPWRKSCLYSLSCAWYALSLYLSFPPSPSLPPSLPLPPSLSLPPSSSLPLPPSWFYNAGMDSQVQPSINSHKRMMLGDDGTEINVMMQSILVMYCTLSSPKVYRRGRRREGGVNGD